MEQCVELASGTLQGVRSGDGIGYEDGFRLP
jgi:hypothetical protein